MIAAARPTVPDVDALLHALASLPALAPVINLGRLLGLDDDERATRLDRADERAGGRSMDRGARMG